MKHSKLPKLTIGYHSIDDLIWIRIQFLNRNKFGKALSPAFDKIIPLRFDRNEIRLRKNRFTKRRSACQNVIRNSGEIAIVSQNFVAPKDKTIAVVAIDRFEDGEDDSLANPILGFLNVEFFKRKR